MKIYSYIVAKDYGLAPNPFWNTLTLNVCKPIIRKSANVGDWVIGTGSKNVKQKSGSTKDHSGSLVYAMKVTEKMTMLDYDKYCNINFQKKIPFKDPNDWRRIVGDSIYYWTNNNNAPWLRKMLHKECDKNRDLSGIYTLLSSDFYYFGCESQIIPEYLAGLIKKEQGHLVSDTNEINELFVAWLTQNFEPRKLYGDPQLKWQIEGGLSGKIDIQCDQ